MAEQRQTYTLNASCQPLTVHQDGVTMPADHSFACINDYVHAPERHFEELQNLSLGMACEIDKLRTVIAQQTAPAVKIDESAEFEKWRSEQIDVLDRNGYPDGAKAFYGLGSVQWSGWQARASLAARRAAEQPAAVAQKPVAWQARFTEIGQKWGDCTKEHHDLVKANPGEWSGYEVRALYPAPPAAEQPDADEIHQMAFEEGQPAENGDGYLFTAEEFDLFVERLLRALLGKEGE